jgi:glycosyltransferase involved in cell wall biosynthesis
MIIAISANPNIVNIARDILALERYQYGRILALLIISITFLVFFSLYSYFKVDALKLHFDKLIRNLCVNDFKEQQYESNFIKPIMVVIPAYNEESNLIELLPKIPNNIYDMDVGVLVVDDGSEDNTVQIVKELGHHVISNKINRGQGAASRIGYDVLTKFNAQIGVTMDADNQHRPEDLKTMIAPIIEQRCDLVIGSRILGDHVKDSHLRNMGINFFSWIISLVMGARVTDSSSGFKAFNVSKMKSLQFTEDQFQSAEVLIEARKKGLRICEVPITITHRKHGISKKGRDLSYGLNFAKTIIKAWWR